MRDFDLFSRRGRRRSTLAGPGIEGGRSTPSAAPTPASSAGLLFEAHNPPPSARAEPVFQTDRDVLLHFYRTTRGELWKCRVGWAENSEDLGSWYGVTTNEDGRVVKLELQGTIMEARFSGNNVEGAIPPQLSRLRYLTKLDLTGNKLSGTIPPELGRLQALEDLLMPYNLLEGNIPPELGQLGALKRLSLAANSLCGQIPAELGKLKSLEQLNMDLNDLEGQVPPELGKLSLLQKLYLRENDITAIPSELGSLTALQNLYLSRNEISGIIPPELGQLCSLEVLDLSWNKLYGAIPRELGGLERLQRLSLTGNKLSDSIPRELGQLGALKRLYLGGNMLSGLIPSELGKLMNLKDFIVSGNQLSGTIPKELGHMKALKAFYIDGNKFTSLGEVEDALRLLNQLVDAPALKNNPWVMPPEAVVEKGGEVLKYLLEVQRAKEAGARIEMLQLLKVVLVGSARAGKTSLVNSIVSGRAFYTKGSPEEVTTVGIDLIRHRLKGTTVEFYDCAGQVDYAGLHQTFLSRRALYLLVWDVRRCQDKHGDALDKVIFEDIMRWLYSLNLRAPGSTVLLVANQCDRKEANGVEGPAIEASTADREGFVATANLVEERVREMLTDWHHERVKELLKDLQNQRGILGNSQAARARRVAAGVILLPQVSTVSCYDGYGLSSLTDRVAAQGAISISVPPAWGLALKVIDALREGRDPLQAAREHLGLGQSLPPPRSQNEGALELPSLSPFMTKAALSQRWNGIVRSVEGELTSKAEKMAVSNWDIALEAALWISEYAGQTLPVANGDGIFLDVKWLSTALKPILSHVLQGKIFRCPNLSIMRDEFVKFGVLRLELAEELWSREMGGLREGLLEALCRVLLDLGVALPLDVADRSTSGVNLNASNSSRRAMLVIMRLPETCSPDQESTLKNRMALHSNVRDEGARQEVVLRWRFDLAGPPYGFVERLIASCRVIGEVEQGLCWRYGAAFKSQIRVEGENTSTPLYEFVVRYDNNTGEGADHSRVLSFRMFGPIADERLWAALRWGASAMIGVSREWRGVVWEGEGWLDCGENHNKVYLVTPEKAIIGGPLVHEPTPNAPSGSCDCLHILKHLGTVLDTRRGDPFAGLPSTKIEGGKARPARETTETPGDPSGDDLARSAEGAVVETPERVCANFCCARSTAGEAFRLWLPAHRDAVKISGCLWTASLTFVGAAVSLKEHDKTGWFVCLGFMGLFLVGAAVATVFACRYKMQKARKRHAAERRQREEEPSRDAANMA